MGIKWDLQWSKEKPYLKYYKVCHGSVPSVFWYKIRVQYFMSLTLKTNMMFKYDL